MRKKLRVIVIMLINLSFLLCVNAAASTTEGNKIEIPPAFQRELPSAGITPDSWFYGFKRFFEAIDLFFTFDDIAKAEKHAKYAELRLAEAKEMAEKGKTEYLDDLIKEYKKNLEKCNEIAKIAQQVGKNVTKVTELVSIATSIHIEVLEEVLEKVPEQAKSSIQKAINCSREGNEDSLNILEKAFPEKAAEIHLRIAEKRLLKAQQKSHENKTKTVEDLVAEYEKRINKSSKIIEIAKELGKNTTNVEQLIAEATSIHIEILSEVYEKVPEEAKHAIKKALNASAAGKEKAVKSLKEKGALDNVSAEAVTIEKKVHVNGVWDYSVM
jgi:DNA-binding ferritin-like protein